MSIGDSKSPCAIMHVAEVARLQGIAKRSPNSYEFRYGNTSTFAHGDLATRVNGRYRPDMGRRQLNSPRPPPVEPI